MNNQCGLKNNSKIINVFCGQLLLCFVYPSKKSPAVDTNVAAGLGQNYTHGTKTGGHQLSTFSSVAALRKYPAVRSVDQILRTEYIRSLKTHFRAGAAMEAEAPVIFSSRGTKWAGFAVELQRMVPERPFSTMTTEPTASSILSPTEATWTACGTKFRSQWRAGTSIFARKGYQLYDIRTSTITQSIVVPLEDEKIVEFQHDDDRVSQSAFLNHVIATDSHIVGLLSAMIAEVRAGNPAGSLFAQAVSVALLTHVQDRYDRSKASKQTGGKLSPRQAATIERHIRDHIHSDMSINELAALLGLSPAYFCRAFAKATGMSPHRFIMNSRVELVRDRLRQHTDSSLSELAADFGFADRTHLSNVFRKFVGISPSEFRRRNM
jgi:AraC family transcriptional regulator